MREAWWFPPIAPVNPGDTPEVMLAERSLPGSFMVNAAGERFANESMDYMSFGQRHLDLEEAGAPTGEMWLVFDQKYRNSYMLGTQLFPGMPLPQAWYDAGIAVRGSNPRELPNAAGLPADSFARSIARFNELAAIGEDHDFQRGNSTYDRYYGDPSITPNPNLRPPFGESVRRQGGLGGLGYMRRPCGRWVRAGPQ